MFIGINASAALKPQPTGVEEYTYQLLKHLSKLDVGKHQVVLYVNGGNLESCSFKIKKLTSPFMWTQVRLGLEMLIHKPDVLFIPVHVLPLIHPSKSVVTIHGLEYEYFPEAYPFTHLRYLRWSTRYALKHASKIIAVSNNTKKDLVGLYGGDPKKIEVVHLGISRMQNARCKMQNYNSKFKINGEYILYMGRLAKIKNIDGLVRAFDILKKKYKIPHRLILAGPSGYRFKDIKSTIHTLKSAKDIIQTGYVTKEEKWRLLRDANVFAFPSLYEGFGMPVLEAQSMGVPVVTSNTSSLPEVVAESALKINPLNTEGIAESIYKLINDGELCKSLISRGYENIKRFSWEKCARETWQILNS